MSDDRSSSPPRSRTRLLIIDDDPQMRRLLTSLLAHYGAPDSLVAEDAAEAAALLASERVDGIVLDLMMPRMHGTELLRVLREHDQTRMTPVLIVSGDGSRESVLAIAELGAFDFVLKPLRPAIVGERLQRFISHCQEQARAG